MRSISRYYLQREGGAAWWSKCRLGEATAGHQHLVRLRPKAWDCPTHAVEATHHLRPHREAVALEPEAAQVNDFAASDHPGGALDGWNGGEGQRTGGCSGKVGVSRNEMPALSDGERASHALVKSMLGRPSGESWAWGGHGTVQFKSSGALDGGGGGGGGGAPGSWGSVPSPWRKDSLHVKLGGETYLLMFLAEKWAFVALRCSDEQVSYGRLQTDPLPNGRLLF